MSRFETIFSGLHGDTISVNPLDSEIFGFRVAEWSFPDAFVPFKQAWVDGRKWLDENEVSLVSCKTPCERPELLGVMQDFGFRVVDCCVTVGERNLLRTKVRQPYLPVREARVEDMPLLVEMSRHAFTTGRYYLDPLFPRHLAEQRYVAWVQNSLNGKTPNTVLVAEYEQEIAGFLVFRLEGDLCQGHLACVNPKFQNAGIFRDILISHREWLRVNGITKTLSGGISIGLMPVIKINLAIEVELLSAFYQFHWHSPACPIARGKVAVDSTHLIANFDI